MFLMVFFLFSLDSPFLTQKRKSSEIPAFKFQALKEKLKKLRVVVRENRAKC